MTKNDKKRFIDEVAKECLAAGKTEKGKLIKRIILIRRAGEFRTFPDELETNILSRIEELKKEETEEERERRQARTLLRKLHENKTPISRDSAKQLFAEAGWAYDENSTFLKLPEGE